MNLTIHEAIDKAVAKMRPVRRAVMQRRLQNEDYRARVADELLLKLWDDKGCCAMVPALNLARSSDVFTATSTFAIDPENLEKFLDLVLKYLPQILEMLLKFLPLLMSVIAMIGMSLAASQANAQYIYASVSSAQAGGGCTGSVKASYGSSGSAVAAPAASGYGCTGSVPVQSYDSSGSAVRSAADGYGSSGSAAAQSYGSSGSAVSQDRRPLRSILENKPIRSRVRSTLENAPVRSRVAAVASVAAAVPRSFSNAYQVALASATERARTGRKGHLMSVEAGYTTGVGYSSFNSNPDTCYGVGGNYAVVRGADGWYSTKVLD